MLSRREVLVLASAAAGMGPVPWTSLEHASQPSTRVNFTVPPSACDCHTHVFGDPRRFSFVPGRTYTPELASVAEMRPGTKENRRGFPKTCVWQSHALGGTVKFTRVEGCDACSRRSEEHTSELQSL